MSFQVGSSCYATQADAGAAACSQFVPVYSQDATNFYSTTCASASATGALNLQNVTTKISNGAITTKLIAVMQSYPACIETDYLVAGETIAGALFGLWAIAYAGYKILSFLGWSRGQND
jgi:hypothetical protein